MASFIQLGCSIKLHYLIPLNHFWMILKAKRPRRPQRQGKIHLRALRLMQTGIFFNQLNFLVTLVIVHSEGTIYLDARFLTVGLLSWRDATQK